MKHNSTSALFNKALVIILFTISSSAFAQMVPKWGTGGNTAASGDFLGTLNNEDLVFKTNNTVAFKIKANGNIIVKSLDSSGNGLVIVDNSGKLIQVPFSGDVTQVLLGDGTFGSLPSGLWSTGSGSKIYYDGGKVGIGTSTPNYKLDVNGDVHISSNLFLDGGLVISDKIQTPKQLKAMSIIADSILMDTTKAFYGVSKFKGDVQLKYKLDVTGAVNFTGPAALSGGAYVTGPLVTSGNFTFAGSKTVSYLPASGGAPEVFGWGVPASVIGPVLTLPYCLAPLPSTINVVNGMNYYQGTNVSGGYLNVMRTGFDGANGIIDVTGASETPDSPSLLINYYCGKNVSICTGTTGGNVAICTGASAGNISMLAPDKGSISIGAGNTGAKVAINSVNKATGLFVTTPITSSVDFDRIPTAIIGETHTPTQVAFLGTLNNTGSPIETCTILGSGQISNKNGITTSVANDNDIAFSIENTSTGTTIKNYMVYGDGHVFARDIKVNLGDFVHPDYVFEKNYKMLSIPELDKFLQQNKHLPNVPSAADIQKNNGFSVTEMSEKQLEKIEELSLYIIELNKKLAALTETVAQLQKKQ